AYENQFLPHETLIRGGLNAFLTWLPEGGRTAVARDIITTTSDLELYNCFMNLFTGLAAPMKSRSKAPSVVQSPHAKRQEQVNIVASTLDQPERRDPSFAAQLQRRENCRCVITERQGEPGNLFHDPTEGAHIIPFAFASWKGAPGVPIDTPATWNCVYKCFPALRQILSSDEINALRNGLTLRDSVHTQFGKFTIALKPTDIKNEYEVKTYKRYPSADTSALPYDRRVRILPNTEYEIPSRAILDAHRRMCEILNASAMGETIERHLRDWEELRGSTSAIIREDGMTDLASLLDIALWGRVSA
ncbi:hypothetical protein N7530_007885, partial [Penicillium desertorum]